MYEELIKRLEIADTAMAGEEFTSCGPTRTAIANAITELRQIDAAICPPAKEAVVTEAVKSLAREALAELRRKWCDDEIKQSTFDSAEFKVATHIQIASQLGQAAGAASRGTLPIKWDIGLSFRQLREANAKRCEQSFHPLKDWSPADWLGCVVGEVGELAHLLKQARRGGEINTGFLADELADVAIYLDLLAAALDIDLGKAVAKKFNETSGKVNSDVKLPE